MSLYPWLAGRQKPASAPYVPPPAVLSPGFFGRVGRLLFGPRWHPEMARALKMSEHNVRFFANGTKPIHANLAADLAALVTAHGDDVEQVEADLYALLKRKR